MAYKYLLWDIDGTILDFKASESAAVKKLFLKYGFGECTDEMVGWYSAINIKYWEALERGEVEKKQMLVERFKEFFELVDIPTSNASQFNADYQVALGDTVVFVEDAMNVLTRLKEKYVLAAITNGTQIAQKNKLKKSGLDNIFDYIFISEEVGYEKPGKNFFDKVVADMKISSLNEALVVGDSLTSDIKGANNAGMDACWYNPQGKINNMDVTCKYEISRLHQIINILGECDERI